jgi:hypothetical protein
MSSFKSLTRRPATRQFVRNYLLDYSGGRRRPTRARKTTRNKYTYIHGRHNNSNSNNKTTRLKNNHDSRVFIHVLEHSCVRALFFFCVHCGIVKPLGRGCCKSATHNGHEIHMSRGMRRSMAVQYPKRTTRTWQFWPTPCADFSRHSFRNRMPRRSSIRPPKVRAGADIVSPVAGRLYTSRGL